MAVKSIAWTRVWYCLLILVPFFLVAAGIYAETWPKSAQATAIGSSVQDNATQDNSTIRVLSVYNHRSKDSVNAKDDQMVTGGLGSRIVVKVEGLKKMLKEEEKRKEERNEALVPYVDGMAIPMGEPRSIDLENETIEFTLLRTEASKAVWRHLLGRPNSFTRRVRISLGFASDGYPYPTKSGTSSNFNLVAIRKGRLWGWLIFVAVVISLCVYLAKKTGLLRSQGASSPYSLAVTQMAVWSFLVVIAYTFIFVVTYDQPTINSNILILLGIGTGTALGGRIIDQNKQVKKLKDKRELLVKKITNTTGSEKESIQKDIDQIDKDISESKMISPPSKGFFEDILCDSDGMTIHRFQIFVWTIVLGMIFLYSVYRDLEMPTFSDTLLALMGISAGTYLGFKIPEQKE